MKTISDWEKWMADHHIKIGGNPNDVRADAGSAGGGISRSKLETKVPNDARTPSCCHIQVFTKPGKIVQAHKKEKEGARHIQSGPDYDV